MPGVMRLSLGNVSTVYCIKQYMVIPSIVMQVISNKAAMLYCKQYGVLVMAMHDVQQMPHKIISETK